MSLQLNDSDLGWCPADAKAGAFYEIHVKDLSPTQFAVGRAEVAVRAGRMRKKYNKGALLNCHAGRHRNETGRWSARPGSKGQHREP